MSGKDRRDRSEAIDGDGWFRAAYGGLAGFFANEGVVRQPGSAASLAASGDDQRTTQKIVAAYAAGAALAPIVRRSPIGRLVRGAAPLGPALEVGGSALRAWSMLTLGASYSRTLRTGEAQPLIDDGPYRFVRHPG
jgi:protein-S-isoprenylcysteine O-methyltransferase Ste14